MSTAERKLIADLYQLHHIKIKIIASCHDMLGDANNISNSSLQTEARNVIVNVLKLDVISVVLCNFTYYITNDANQHVEHSQ